MEIPGSLRIINLCLDKGYIIQPHRSAIENLIRYIVISGGYNPSQIPSTYLLFEKAKEVASKSGNKEFKNRINLLYQIYSELCNYVHTSGTEYSTFAQALIEYPNFNEEKFENTLKELIRSLKLINVVMMIIENKTFKSMYHVNKEAILDNMTAEEKRLFN